MAPADIGWVLLLVLVLFVLSRVFGFVVPLLSGVVWGLPGREAVVDVDVVAVPVVDAGAVGVVDGDAGVAGVPLVVVDESFCYPRGLASRPLVPSSELFLTCLVRTTALARSCFGRSRCRRRRLERAIPVVQFQGRSDILVVVSASRDDTAAEEGGRLGSQVLSAEAGVEDLGVAALELPFEIAVVVSLIDARLGADAEL